MSKLLIKWFDKHQRDLPWRYNRTPYRVWISEIMLQQTQVNTVIDYFNRWMNRWPDIHSLAKSPIEEVIKVWEGLGYYSRARSIHQSAIQISNEYNGIFPKDPKLIAQLRGIGPYTQGAICSLAFKERFAAIDGNASRVLSRYWGIDGDITKSSTRKELSSRWLKQTEELPIDIANEALIELGALLCKPKINSEVHCAQCPLKSTCYAFNHKKIEQFPKIKPRTPITDLWRPTLVLTAVDKELPLFLVRKNIHSQVMSGLWEWPYIDHDEPLSCPEVIYNLIYNHFNPLHQTSPGNKNYPIEKMFALHTVKHSFTRYRATLYPIVFALNPKDNLSTAIDDDYLYKWVTIDELKSLAFSSGHKKISLQLLKKNMLLSLGTF